MIQQEKNKISVNLHLIKNGRNTKTAIALKFLDIIEDKIKNDRNINISSLSGRHYSMDRDYRWSKTKKTYNILTQEGDDIENQDYHLIIKNFYSKEICDEFISPIKVSRSIIKNNDDVLFFNLRPNRIRQLIQSLTKPRYKGFTIKKIKNLLFTTFTEYDPSIDVHVIFKPTI